MTPVTPTTDKVFRTLTPTLLHPFTLDFSKPLSFSINQGPIPYGESESRLRERRYLAYRRIDHGNMADERLRTSNIVVLRDTEEWDTEEALKLPRASARRSTCTAHNLWSFNVAFLGRTL